jgi:hypothetical protein
LRESPNPEAAERFLAGGIVCSPSLRNPIPTTCCRLWLARNRLAATRAAVGAWVCNWLRVSIRLGAARLDERLGWEEMAAAKRAMR